MKYMMFFINIGIQLVLVIGSQVESRTLFEIKAEEIMIKANEEYLRLSAKFRETFWRSRPIFLPKQNGLETNYAEEYRNFTVNVCEDLKLLPFQSFENKDLRRQIEILSKLQIVGLDFKDFEEAISLLKTMQKFALSESVCSFGNPSKCSYAYLPHVNDIIAKTRNVAELEHYWTEWRKIYGSTGKKLVQEYIEFYRKAAALNGHITPSITWYMYYDDEHFLNELSKSMKHFSPLYKEFHAYVRYIIKQRYGEYVITNDGPIPEHFMDQVILHAWRQNSLLSPPFPQRHLPDIKDGMVKQGYGPRKLIEMGHRFYLSLGLMNLPTSFWTKYAKVILEKDAGPDCKAKVYDLGAEVGIKYCPRYDFKKFLQMHGHMANVQYHLHKNRLPFGLNREACPGIGSAIGEAAILSASSPRHLERLGLMANYTLDDELTLNRLFRLGKHTILNIPRYFINEKFWVDILDYRILPSDYNQHYWKLQEDFAGVEPPILRSKANFDPSYKFYEGIDDRKPNTLKFVSEVIGYQIYRALCLKSGEYIPGNTHRPLHNCDFYGNREVGRVLGEAMSLGSGATCRDVLEIITGERNINVTALYEFFEPLYIWLKEKNEENYVEIGWTSSNKFQQCDDYDCD